jgi:hypothetical protein
VFLLQRARRLWVAFLLGTCWKVLLFPPHDLVNSSLVFYYIPPFIGPAWTEASSARSPMQHIVGRVQISADIQYLLPEY